MYERVPSCDLIVVVDNASSVLVGLGNAPALIVLVLLGLSSRVEVGTLRLAAHTDCMAAVWCEAIRGTVILQDVSKSQKHLLVKHTVTRLSQKATSCLFHWNRT